ncbi:hypothetical protein P7G51_01435 [Enterococcus asini]|uniref:hypothetical protein n=1 Tax=Enterococcus asini TaxID=57732 RepID=UPI00288E0372|nr:hypothetical protein [Enterococcus asini]MDT2756051.1 hypothetical protein [Enterococcus asini]
MENMNYQSAHCKTALTKGEFDPQNPVSHYYVSELVTGAESMAVNYGDTEFDQDSKAFISGIVGLVAGIILFSLICLLGNSLSHTLANSPIFLFASIALSWYSGEKIGHLLNLKIH